MKMIQLPVKIKKYLLAAGVLLIIILAVTGRLFGDPAVTEPELIANEELLILATPKSNEELREGQVYTDRGLYTYPENLSIEKYLFESVQAVTEGKQILQINNLLKRRVTMENCLIAENTEQQVTVFSEGLYISIPCSNLQQSLGTLIADLDIANGEVIKISAKRDSISGKILSVRNEGIEIQGYGLIPVSENFRFYEIYGEWKERGVEGLIVGYDKIRLTAAEGKICAALLEEEISMDNIRVLIKTTDFTEIIHPSVTLKANGNYKITYEGGEAVLADGHTLTVGIDSEYLKGERVIFTPEAEGNTLEISSIQRALGTPAYSGSLEISKDSAGLVVVNELKLEEYLYHVVPSEMPASYELEALKAQAICARSYAYRQILQNSYADYGAHVDDSVSYQVYNNLPTDEKVRQAVDETKGKVLKYAGEVATAYYFSTSCGYTTNETIWLNGTTENAYISGKLLNDSMEKLDLTSEEAFREFILNEAYETYDSGESWYRWEIEVPAEHLGATIASYGEIGSVQKIEVVSRNEGGAVQKVRITGTEGSLELETEHEIRKAFNGEGCTVKRQHGSDTSGGKMLPSGFFIVDPVKEEDGSIRGFLFRGGGFGHGAGMSQNGANNMAEAGKNCEEILHLFYTGAAIEAL